HVFNVRKAGRQQCKRLRARVKLTAVHSTSPKGRRVRYGMTSESSTNTRTALVTGGGGFIGSTLAGALIERGLRVRIIDNFATGKRAQIDPRAGLHEGDIRDLESIRPAFAGVDCVFHVAAL